MAPKGGGKKQQNGHGTLQLPPANGNGGGKGKGNPAPAAPGRMHGVFYPPRPPGFMALPEHHSPRSARVWGPSGPPVPPVMIGPAPGMPPPLYMPPPYPMGPPPPMYMARPPHTAYGYGVGMGMGAPMGAPIISGPPIIPGPPYPHFQPPPPHPHPPLLQQPPPPRTPPMASTAGPPPPPPHQQQQQQHQPLSPQPQGFLGRSTWERGLGEMLKVEREAHTLSKPKYGARLLVPKPQEPGEEGEGEGDGGEAPSPPMWNDDPGLPLDLGVVTVTGGADGGAQAEAEEEELYLPKGYEAAPPVVLRTPLSAAAAYGATVARAARPPPTRVTRPLRIEHGAPGPYLLREVLVIPRDEPGSGIWVEVEVGGWVFSSLSGQAPTRAETEDAPEPLQGRGDGDVLLPPGATDASVAVLAEQDAERAAVQKWLLLRMEGPGVGTPADMHVHHFVLARRLLATVVDPYVASLLSVEARPFVPQSLRECFDRPCALAVAFPRKPPPFQPRTFAAYLRALGEFPLPAKLKEAAARFRAQGEEADPYQVFGIHRAVVRPKLYVENLAALVQLEELQAERDMRRYDLFSVRLDYREQPPTRAESEAADAGAEGPKQGKLLVTITVPGAAENRPPLAYGDEVRLRPAGAGEAGGPAMVEVRAVVLDRKEERVRLLLPPEFPTEAHPPGSRWHVRFTYERFAFRFLRAGLQRLTATAEGLANSMRFLFPIPDATPQPPPLVAREEDICWINPLVNTEQKAAVTAIVNGAHGRAPFLLFGPPGTGKTLTLIEAILQVCAHVPGAKVLAVAPSDVAADIVCERLAARLRPSELFRLNWYSRRFESLKIALLPYSCWDAGAGLFSLPVDPDPYGFVQRCKVVVCTCAASGLLALLRRPGEAPLEFTHVFVDESSQALQPEILVPLSLAGPETSVILAGDPKQLGPSTRSPLVSQLGLGKSLQEHLMDTRAMYDVQGRALPQGRKYIVRLSKNYRSHQAIIEVPSRLFYEESLEQHGDPKLIHSMLNWEMLPGSSSAEGGRAILPAGLPISPLPSKDGNGGSDGGFPVLFYGVQGEHMHELDSPSFWNPMECSKVLDLVRALVGSRRVQVGVNDLAVITSFRKQVLKLRALLREHGFGAVNVGQVEDFQGQEARVVIISTVLASRNANDITVQEQLGFLGHPKRFNVAVTRAQALTIIVGSPFALWEDAAGWRQLLEFAAAHGSYRGCDCPMLRAQDVDGVGALLDAIANESLLGGAAASEVYPTSLEDWFSDSPWRLLL